jgi:hypothetical protein
MAPRGGDSRGTDGDGDAHGRFPDRLERAQPQPSGGRDDTGGNLFSFFSGSSTWWGWTHVGCFAGFATTAPNYTQERSLSAIKA